jgi:endonuclease-8
MPEGPSIVILRDELRLFEGKKIKSAEGNAGIDFDRLINAKVTSFKSWGKHLLICFPGFFVKIHLMMFGTYRINERKKAIPRLRIIFSNGEVSFYACSVKTVDGHVNDAYDWRTDLMSPQWNSAKARKMVSALKQRMICDVLLDQDIFSGAGNIIKNEVLFRTRTNPKATVRSLSIDKRNQIVKDMRVYSRLFFRWKKKYELKKHWLIYKRPVCPNCGRRVTRAYLGIGQRLTCFCKTCQV